MAAAPAWYVLLGRALSKRCPRCGRGDVFQSYFKMNRECPSCHVVFWKEPGEFLGAMYFDYAMAFSLFFVAWVLLVWLTNLSDLVQIAILSIIVVGSVVVFYPLSRSLWTLMIYISGGIDRPPIRVVRGRK